MSPVKSGLRQVSDEVSLKGIFVDWPRYE